MTPQRISNYVTLCREFGQVTGDGFKVSHVMRVNGCICWIDTYTDTSIGTWFQYPAMGIQVKLS